MNKKKKKVNSRVYSKQIKNKNKREKERKRKYNLNSCMCVIVISFNCIGVYAQVIH